jgi:two-component system sensor histidine kinase CssS
MKKFPLIWQLWLFVVSIGIIFGLLLMLVLPKLLDRFFTNEIFSTIESAQTDRFDLIMDQIQEELIWRELGILPDNGGPLPIAEDGNIRAVTHVVIHNDGMVKSRFELSEELLSMMEEAISRYKLDGTTRFSYPYQGKTLYLSMMYGDYETGTMYLFSYMTNDYRDLLVADLLRQMLFVIGGLLVIAWIPAFFMAKFWTRPLLTLQRHVQSYARRELDESVSVNRTDEIGELAASIDIMRQKLKQHDESQQSVLQHVSHELKTPVMVIRGYIQSILDGMLTGEKLQSAAFVMEQEAKRLEKRIGELLYMTKLDYLSKRNSDVVDIELAEFVESIAERMRWLKPDLDWQFELQAVVVTGDMEQWQVAIENILDNQIRYAQSTIRIAIEIIPDGRKAILNVWNDGPPLTAGTEELMFEAFRKGTNGKFGLGLAIVRRIADLHGVRVSARNERGGVLFQLEFPVS